MVGAVQAAQQELAAIPTKGMSRLPESGDVDEVAKLLLAIKFDRPHHAEPFLDKILTATREFFHLSPDEKVMYNNMVDADVAAVRGSFPRSTASTTSTPTGRSSTGATGYASRSSQRRNVGWISSQNTC
uniref:Uncharacterized protein n=1 Tax=Oryza barthii TaxID=65489 RepID=A0A0D3GI97_9ORYZ